MIGLTTAAAAALVLKKYFNKKVEAITEKVKEEESTDGKYYLFIREGEREELFVPHYNSQDLKGKLNRIKSVIQAYNGTNLIQNTTSEGTMIFFNMPGSSTIPMEKELKKYGEGLSLGKATKS